MSKKVKNTVKQAREVLKVFIWKFYDKAKMEQWEKFQKISIFKGQSPGDSLAAMVADFNASNHPNFTILTESELIEHLNVNGLNTSRKTLKEWRESDILLEKDGDRLWFTDGNSICYNLQGVVKFIQSRRM